MMRLGDKCIFKLFPGFMDHDYKHFKTLGFTYRSSNIVSVKIITASLFDVDIIFLSTYHHPIVLGR